MALSRLQIIAKEVVANAIMNTFIDRQIEFKKVPADTLTAMLKTFIMPWTAKIIKSSKPEHKEVIEVLNFIVARGLSRLAAEYIMMHDADLMHVMKNEAVKSIGIYAISYMIPDSTFEFEELDGGSSILKP
jgi:hypothetical protein